MAGSYPAHARTKSRSTQSDQIAFLVRGRWSSCSRVDKGKLSHWLATLIRMAEPRGHRQTEGPLEGHYKQGRVFRPPQLAYEVTRISDWVREDLLLDPFR